MSYDELHECVFSGNLERIRQLVEGGVNIDEANENDVTALLLACSMRRFEMVVYLVEHGANVTHADGDGMTALHYASLYGLMFDTLPTVTYLLLKHGARIAERNNEGATAFLFAAEKGNEDVVQYLLSSEGGASITEIDDQGNTALLLAADALCFPSLVQWLLEFGGAQITDTDKRGASVWTRKRRYEYQLVGYSLAEMLKSAYTKSDDGKFVIIDGEYIPEGGIVWGPIVELTAMLRAMVLHGGPPESLTTELAPPFQQIVHDGVRLRARLPAYLAQRRALVDAHCPLPPPLQALVNSYEVPTTTDELWAMGIGAALQRAKRTRSKRGQFPERRSARLRQKRL
jgi:hypothetical protein